MAFEDYSERKTAYEKLVDYLTKDEATDEESEEMECLACELFIEDGGGTNWAHIEEVYWRYGIWVHAGERDSFGWLTGVVEMLKGGKRDIVFG